MVSVAEALEMIRARSIHYGAESIDLLQTTGRVLAQDIIADRDFPPFDRVTMDGIAISSQTFANGQRSYRIEYTLAAGSPQQPLINLEYCIEVMTGAELPQGCDAVVPYEDCTIAGQIAYISADKVQQVQHIHPKASDEQAGQVLVAAGTVITPAIIGVAAAVGMQQISVQRLPRVVVCSTGDELVSIDIVPEAHQIRRSNSYMLLAALRELNISATLNHLPDEPEFMKKQLAEMLVSYDVLLFSGAVSKGKFDFLPVVLAETGMDKIFHGVAQKPGKPLLFGQFKTGQIVFGFPGNPVSSLVCFHVFFKAWLHAAYWNEMPLLTAYLAEDFSFRPALSYHLPVTVSVEDGRLMATPNAGNNSGDMVSLLRTEAVITLPPSRIDFKKGELFPLTRLHQLA